MYFLDIPHDREASGDSSHVVAAATVDVVKRAVEGVVARPPARRQFLTGIAPVFIVSGGSERVVPFAPYGDWVVVVLVDLVGSDCPDVSRRLTVAGRNCRSVCLFGDPRRHDEGGDEQSSVGSHAQVFFRARASLTSATMMTALVVFEVIPSSSHSFASQVNSFTVSCSK